MSFADRRRALIIGAAGRVLPGIYQQCAYISAASNNKAYINLGITFDTAASTEIGYIFQGKGANLQIFGAAENGGTSRYLLSANYNIIANQLGSFYSTKADTHDFGNAYWGSTQALLSVGDEIRLRFEVARETPKRVKAICYNDNTITYSSWNVDDYSMTRDFYLLGQNYNTGYRGNGLKQVTYFRHWDKDDILVRDMIPCYRKSDGVIGMWDFISKTFFTNAGSSGSFTKGADV